MEKPEPAPTDGNVQPIESPPDDSSEDTLVLNPDAVRLGEEITHVPTYRDPDDYGIRRIIKNFTPSWYVVTMGTGIVSSLFHAIPYHARWLNILSTIFFVLNLTLFTLFTLTTILRFAIWPELWGAVLRSPHQSLFLGTIPTGYSTLINSVVLICAPAWGDRWVVAAWGLWWVDIVVSVGICFRMTFVVMSISRPSLEQMTALWLLPILPVVLCATTGGFLTTALTPHHPQHALWTLTISYTILSSGLYLALTTLVLYFHRLTVHQLPPKEVIVSVFLPIGVFGLGGFNFLLLGRSAATLLPLVNALPHIPSAGPTLYALGFFLQLTMWGAGLVWFFFAVTTIYQVKRFPFNMGWWGFTFPIGVFALSTMTLGEEIESRFFKVLGTVLAAAVVGLWGMCAVGTVRKTVSGEMFYAPCLQRDQALVELRERKRARHVAGGEGAEKAV